MPREFHRSEVATKPFYFSFQAVAVRVFWGILGVWGDVSTQLLPPARGRLAGQAGSRKFWPRRKPEVPESRKRGRGAMAAAVSALSSLGVPEADVGVRRGRDRAGRGSRLPPGAPG